MRAPWLVLTVVRFTGSGGMGRIFMTGQCTGSRLSRLRRIVLILVPVGDVALSCACEGGSGKDPLWNAGHRFFPVCKREALELGKPRADCFAPARGKMPGAFGSLARFLGPRARTRKGACLWFL